MSKIKDMSIQEEEKLHKEFIEEQEARRQTIVHELEHEGLSREQMISHEEELELILDI
ncbi:MAG: hypothetical protein HOG49_41605 [Candidatus Scalindua sp.]|jgi:hypothetical protein|nr:hypothetical protein [Candidatus Scalindua sp.]